MSVRVNLLPQATKARGRASRQRGVVLLVFLFVLLILAAVWFWQALRLGDAEDQLAEEEQQTAMLQAEVDELDPYRDLVDQTEARDEAITTALDWEVSVGGILQDLAATVPEDAQLDNLTITVLESRELDPVTGRPTAGDFTLTARSLTDHAPGVERFLLSLDSYISLFDLHVSSSTLEQDRDDDLPVVTFNVEGRLSEDLRTERYEDGLPEVTR